MKKKIRYNENGKPDDIVIKCDSVHLERLNDGCWWIGAYKGDERIVIYLTVEDYRPKEPRTYMNIQIIEES